MITKSIDEYLKSLSVLSKHVTFHLFTLFFNKKFGGVNHCNLNIYIINGVIFIIIVIVCSNSAICWQVCLTDA